MFMFPQFRSVGNGIFWAIFAIMGVLIALRVSLVDIFLGVAVVLLGIFKVGNELQERAREKERESLQQTLKEIREWIEHEYRHLQRMEARYENRFFQLSKKRIASDRRVEKNYRDIVRATDKKIDKNYRELVRKVLQLENKMNDISRAFLKSQSRSGRKKGL